MLFGRTNVNKFMVEEQRRNPELAGDFSMLISDVVRSCKAVAVAVARGALAADSSSNAADRRQDAQRTMFAESNETILQHCEWGGHVAAMSSSGMDEIYAIPANGRRGKYLLVFDPLDGSANTDVNLTDGSIFSVLRCPDREREASEDEFLQPGSQQMAAGYALYGSSTMLILTVGTGTHGFTLDREIGEFLLTHPNLHVPEETQIFSINASKSRFWEPPVRRYVEECLDGPAGVRGKEFNMRWAAAMVADVHRILMRGGVFICPRNTRDPSMPGHLPLLHKANPIAMIIEQAGGMATTGYERVLDVVPTDLRQKVPLILGSRAEIERISRYHKEYLNGEDKPFRSPLFGTRSLFRSDEFA